MKVQLSRTLLMPALLAITIALLAVSTSASSDDDSRDMRGEHHHRYDQARQEERRQVLHERAGIDEATRQALEEARSQHHEALHKLHEGHRQQMNEILGEEQREALKQAQREMQEEYRTERRQALEDRIEGLIDGWELSNEQRDTLRETREAIYADIQALRERDFDSREERRDATRKMRREHQATLAILLDESQLEELSEAMRPSDHYRHPADEHHGKVIGD